MKPWLWINGVKAEESYMVFNNGTVLDNMCTAFLGNEKSMTMGVVYREGGDCWFARFYYDYLQGTYLIPLNGTQNKSIYAAEAKYTLHPVFGNTITGMFKINVIPTLEGLSIMCFPSTPLMHEMINTTARQDLQGIWSNSLTIYYFPSKPRMTTKTYGPNMVFGGDLITFTCEAFVRRNGTIFWKLTTASRVYVWNKRGNRSQEDLPEWVTIMDENEDINSDNYQGPRYRSTIRLVMHRQFEKARLECFSDTDDGYYIYPHTKDIIVTFASETLAASVFFAVGVPEIEIDIVEKIVKASCSVDVGTGGSVQWELLLSNWLRYCWTVDIHGKMEGTIPPFLITNSTEGVEKILPVLLNAFRHLYYRSLAEYIRCEQCTILKDRKSPVFCCYQSVAANDREVLKFSSYSSSLWTTRVDIRG
ncbi:hypothetical protein PoB_000546700 [Plakobranchus ocellatus]|uniref:Ig-like domain-containing protein n=1 Tax=Plakobranchus ocellatus TaxID=259542 RepID=A0AAV3Y851_9GAST|nr:hypothetical protein PoB_000546700 [Plakobranchus ocellatus]